MSKTAAPVRKSTTQKHRVFVYGTLKRGNGNHHLLSRSEFIGKATTAPEFRLLSAFRNVFPYLVPGDKSIIGEVFEVDDETLRHLDQLEGYRPGAKNNHYNRVTIPVNVGGEAMDVLVYVLNVDMEEDLSKYDEFPGNDWKSGR